MTPKLEYVYATALIVSFCQIVIFFTSLEFEVEGWGKDVSRNISVYLTDENINTFPSNLCQRESTLLIAVSSAPSNIKARQTVRETWGSQKRVLGESFELVFFVGNSLNSSIQEAVSSESEKYNDVVGLDFKDSYYNLTLKSVLVLKVALSKCSGKTNFLLKIDDDMFLNVPRLMKLLIGRNYSENLLLGKKMCGTYPIKDPLSKWYCPKYMYDDEYFPNFLSGTGYLMSMAAANKLYIAALDLPLIHLEDVFITGLSAESAGIIPEFNKEFTCGAVNDDYCKFQSLITLHEFPPRRMRETFNHLNNPDRVDCSNYEPMFEADKWLRKTVFMPLSRSRRLRICS